MAWYRKSGEPVPILNSLVMRLMLCVAISYLAWKYLGPVGLVSTAPVFGVAFAGPIMRLVAGVVRLLRARAMHDLQGRHFVHLGHTFLIDTDDAGHCWLDVQDLRRAGVQLPADALLVVHFAAAELQTGAKGKGLLLRADALLRSLQGSSSADTRRFSIWLDRMVITPAQRAHETRFSRSS